LQPFASAKFKITTEERQKQPQTQRSVSEAEAHRIYAQYRSEYEGIPDRDEETAHMKQFGIGRNWVRAERSKFPRRRRGEKKIKTKSSGQIGS
jgi:hypothetical protein